MLSFVYVDFPYDIIYSFKPLVKKNVLTISNFDIILKMKYRMSILRGGAMSKKALDTLTETMFYVLMAFSRQDMCGTEIAGYVKDITGGRVSMGPRYSLHHTVEFSERGPYRQSFLRGQENNIQHYRNRQGYLRSRD